MLLALKEKVENYYNTLLLIQNDPTNGLAKITVPEKPDALLITEEIEEYKILPLPGGVWQQPHILWAEIQICKSVKRVYEISANLTVKG